MGLNEGILAPYDANYYLEMAKKRTGLSNFGDEHFRGPLQIYLHAIEKAQMSLVGRMIKLQEVLRLLENRLRIEDELTRTPEILDQQVAKPIFIVSLSRAGSSILFELMSQKSRIRSTLFWEAIEPCPPPETATYDTDPRIKSTEDAIESWNRLAPDFPSKHLTGPTVPVECLQIMSFSFVTAHFVYAISPQDYFLRFSFEDWVKSYEYYKRVLKLLQFKTKDKQWLLKSPAHLHHLPEMLTVFPDARVVLIHRDPKTVMASVVSTLVTVYRDVFGAPFDGSEYLRTYYLDSIEGLLTFLMSAYDEWTSKGATIVNVQYEDVVAHPVEAISRIYSDIGMRVTKQDQEAVARYVAKRPKHKYGKHSYSLPPEIDVNVVRKQFAAYMQKFNVREE